LILPVSRERGLRPPVRTCPAKDAVHRIDTRQDALSDQAARGGPDNERINCIAPGLVKTEFARVLYEDPQRRAAREAATPLRRLGEPEDIAGVALMLASRAGAFITGQTIIVDGGTTIAP
jgi:NAD(P)-dependent dehydrogenase (short-subunit alcohol dehydrogenase family)